MQFSGAHLKLSMFFEIIADNSGFKKVDIFRLDSMDE